MRVHHRRTDIPVPQQFLNRPDIVAVLQQLRGERVAKGVAACWFGNPSGQARRHRMPVIPTLYKIRRA